MNQNDLSLLLPFTTLTLLNVSSLFNHGDHDTLKKYICIIKNISIVTKHADVYSSTTDKKTNKTKRQK